MPWGSNITNSEIPLYVPEFQPATWAQIGANKRAEEQKNKATLSVAEARKGVREKFMQDRENKAYLATKQELETKLQQAQAELAEIEKLIPEAKAQYDREQMMVSGATNTPTTRPMDRSPIIGGSTGGFANQTPQNNTAYDNAYSQIPLFGQKVNR